MYKKLALTALVFVALATAIPVAADPTSGTVTWDGSGTIAVDVFFEDDAEMHMNTAGSWIWGTLSFEDGEDNPYSYDVDTCWSQLVAGFEEGYLEFFTIRTDSWESMYGDPGQTMYSWIEGGWGEIAKFEWTNYAQMRSCNYGKPRTSGGHHFEAGGDFFNIFTVIDNGAGEYAWANIYGSNGSAWLDLMNEDIWGDMSFKFGRGCGCYTDADWYVEADSWTFEREAYADNWLTIHNHGYDISGPAYYHETISGSGAFGDSDVSMEGG